MAKYIVIERPNGVVTIVRSEIETGSEEPLTEHEQIINELYSKVKKLDLTPVSNFLLIIILNHKINYQNEENRIISIKFLFTV